jgi:hypothetical protein
MTSSAIADTKITNVTLKLFESSGWYQVDYSSAEPFWWGKGKGCNFINTPCVAAGVPSFQPEYCPTLAAEGCSFAGRDKGYCGVYPSAPTQSGLNSAFNYWGDNTVVFDSFADNCPYINAFSNGNCEDPQFSSGTSSSRYIAAEYFGHGSRCFSSKFGTTGHVPATKESYCLKNYVKKL